MYSTIGGYYNVLKDIKTNNKYRDINVEIKMSVYLNEPMRRPVYDKYRYAKTLAACNKCGTITFVD